MAKIWPVYDGREPTRGGPWAEIPLPEVISLFDLRQEDFVSGLEDTPRFGDQNYDFWTRGFQHIVVKAESPEAKRAGWRPGFYKAKIKPDEAFDRLLQYAAASELGKQSVLRVTHKSTANSAGQPAVKVTVVITPDGLKKLETPSALDALVRLQDQLQNMREERVPIIEYATEEELAQDADS